MKFTKCHLLKTLGRRRVCNAPVLSRPLSSDSDKKVRIGCSSGFWGDTPTAVPQLIYGGNIQYLVSDYLSEITMSLLVAARNKNPQLGFTPGEKDSVSLGQNSLTCLLQISWSLLLPTWQRSRGEEYGL